MASRKKMVHLAGKKMNLGKFVFRPMTHVALRRRRIDPALSPKRESQPLLQWDGKTPRTGNGGR